MPTPVIHVENLSKLYQLGTIGYGSLQHDLLAWWAKVRGKVDPNAKVGQKSRLDLHGEFWALRDVTFSVGQGDRIGIIGRNGAGKSTLLKLLSRVTSPTTGRIKVKGRIASLLEVGTGFHPELSGRENVFLNGAILGMKRREIQAKFDEIVSFAGIEQFVDTPVKRYSSGMYVRLAFSVAAHLDSEILIVDEVLAVGDADFQRKSLGKLENLSKNLGKTVLLVSHHVNTVSRLCNKGLLLEGGVSHRGITGIEEALAAYSSERARTSTHWRREESTKDKSVGLESRLLAISSESSPPDSAHATFKNSERLTVTVGVFVFDQHQTYSIGIAIYNQEGFPVFWSTTMDTTKERWPTVEAGYNEFTTTIAEHLLNEGEYRLELISSVHARFWIDEPAVSAPSLQFQIRGGLSESEYWQEKRPGILAPVLEWKRTK